MCYAYFRRKTFEDPTTHVRIFWKKFTRKYPQEFLVNQKAKSVFFAKKFNKNETPYTSTSCCNTRCCNSTANSYSTHCRSTIPSSICHILTWAANCDFGRARREDEGAGLNSEFLEALVRITYTMYLTNVFTDNISCSSAMHEVVFGICWVDDSHTRNIQILNYGYMKYIYIETTLWWEYWVETFLFLVRWLFPSLLWVSCSYIIRFHLLLIGRFLRFSFWKDWWCFRIFNWVQRILLWIKSLHWTEVMIKKQPINHTPTTHSSAPNIKSKINREVFLFMTDATHRIDVIVVYGIGRQAISLDIPPKALHWDNRLQFIDVVQRSIASLWRPSGALRCAFLMMPCCRCKFPYKDLSRAISKLHWWWHSTFLHYINVMLSEDFLFLNYAFFASLFSICCLLFIWC